MVKIAFAGAFAARLAEPVRGHLTMPHEIVVADEAAIGEPLLNLVPRL
jgi:hypothetical protein